MICYANETWVYVQSYYIRSAKSNTTKLFARRWPSQSVLGRFHINTYIRLERCSMHWALGQCRRVASNIHHNGFAKVTHCQSRQRSPHPDETIFARIIYSIFSISFKNFDRSEKYNYKSHRWRYRRRSSSCGETSENKVKARHCLMLSGKGWWEWKYSTFKSIVR